MCSIVVALASGSPDPSQLTKNPTISVCMASTSQAGCPSTSLEPASGTAYVQEVPEANLLHFLLTVTQHGECRGLEVQMHTAAQKDGTVASEAWSLFITPGLGCTAHAYGSEDCAV